MGKGAAATCPSIEGAAFWGTVRTTRVDLPSLGRTEEDSILGGFVLMGTSLSLLCPSYEAPQWAVSIPSPRSASISRLRTSSSRAISAGSAFS